MTVRSPGFGRSSQDGRRRVRALLLDTALRLFSERGYVGVRVEDIAKEAGVSRATFYKHFAEREEILAELFDRLVRDVPLPTPPGPDADALPRVRELLTAAATRMAADEQLARFVYTLPIRHAALLGEGARPPVMEQVEELIERGAAAGVVRPDVPPMLITAQIARTFEAAMRDWAEHRAPDVAEHLAVLLDLTFQGIDP
ncbi:TetR/AcrR family transcriptional regulator [Actinomadura formosensis]|uniref:TetR/AcrR family transcriptional regulator n=1 Tax=Actinomadura formosensis TaxID=60706 RepID=UPI000833944D|nr:TetR/AcrR family transcriptional regulator [Actinomadura formosensis]